MTSASNGSFVQRLSAIAVNDFSKPGQCNPKGAMHHNSEFHSPLWEETGKQQAAITPHMGNNIGGRPNSLSQLNYSNTQWSNHCLTAPHRLPGCLHSKICHRSKARGGGGGGCVAVCPKDALE